MLTDGHGLRVSFRDLVLHLADEFEGLQLDLERSQNENLALKEALHHASGVLSVTTGTSPPTYLESQDIRTGLSSSPSPHNESIISHMIELGHSRLSGGGHDSHEDPFSLAHSGAGGLNGHREGFISGRNTGSLTSLLESRKRPSGGEKDDETPTHHKQHALIAAKEGHSTPHSRHADNALSPVGDGSNRSPRGSTGSRERAGLPRGRTDTVTETSQRGGSVSTRLDAATGPGDSVTGSKPTGRGSSHSQLDRLMTGQKPSLRENSLGPSPDDQLPPLVAATSTSKNPQMQPWPSGGPSIGAAPSWRTLTTSQGLMHNVQGREPAKWMIGRHGSMGVRSIPSSLMSLQHIGSMRSGKGPLDRVGAGVREAIWGKDSLGEFDEDRQDEVRYTLPEDWPRCLQLRSKLDRDLLSPLAAVQAARSIKSSRDYWLSTTPTLSAGPGNDAEELARCILEPTSMLLVLFGLIKFFILFYDLAFAPFTIAWEVQVSDFERGMAWAQITIWTVDIFLNFRTAIDNHGHLERGSWEIAHNYICGGFPLDISLVSLDIASLILMQASEEDTRSRTLRMARIIRIFKVFRLPTLRVISFPFMEWIHASQDAQIAFSFVRLLLFIFWFNHCISCAWFLLSSSFHSDTGARWVDAPTVDYNGYDEMQTYARAPRKYQYFTALHWSLTQMTPASMQVNSVNTNERIFNICCLVMGTLVFTFNVSLLSAKLTQRMILSQRANEQQKTLDRFLRQGSVSRSLSMRIKKQVTERMGYKPLVSMEDVQPSISTISVSLQKELQAELSLSYLVQHDFFLFCHRVHKKCTEALGITSCSVMVLSPGDNLFMAGAMGEYAYVLAKGQLTYAQPAEFSKLKEETLDFVKAGEWVSEPAIWTTWTHVGHADAHKACMLLQIDASKCMMVLNQTPALWDVALQYGRIFHRWLSLGDASGPSWPTDLSHPDCFAEVVQSMEPDTRLFIGLFALSLMKRSRKSGFYQKQFGRFAHLDELEADLRSERCTLTPVRKEIVRVSSVVVIRIQRYDGYLLVQLGKSTNGVITPACRLPGNPCPPGADPGSVLQSLLRGKLKPVSRDLEVTSVAKRTEVMKSRHFQVLTHYLQTVYHAEYKGNERHIDTTYRRMVLLRQRTAAMPATTEVWAHEQDGTLYYFGWMTEDCLARMNAAAELNNIRQSLSELVNDEDASTSESEEGDHHDHSEPHSTSREEFKTNPEPTTISGQSYHWTLTFPPQDMGDCQLFPDHIDGSSNPSSNAEMLLGVGSTPLQSRRVETLML